jgi:hypothetical protein
VIVNGNIDEAELLRLVASVERASERPLAGAIVRGAEERGLTLSDADLFEAISGHGLEATVDGRRLAVGNRGVLARDNVSLDGLAERAEGLAGEGKTGHVRRGRWPADGVGGSRRPAAVDGTRSDRGAQGPRPGGGPDLRRYRQKAEAVAGRLGINRVFAEVLPADKADYVKRLQAEGEKVAMSAMASTTPRRSPRRTLEWRSRRGPTSPSRPPTSY